MLGPPVRHFLTRPCRLKALRTINVERQTLGSFGNLLGCGLMPSQFRNGAEKGCADYRNLQLSESSFNVLKLPNQQMSYALYERVCATMPLLQCGSRKTPLFTESYPDIQLIHWLI